MEKLCYTVQENLGSWHWSLFFFDLYLYRYVCNIAANTIHLCSTLIFPDGIMQKLFRNGLKDTTKS